MQRTYLLNIFLAGLLIGWAKPNDKWIAEKYTGYTIFYTSSDKDNRKEYLELIDAGIKSVKVFFGSSFSNEFEIYIHPDRYSLDSAWQKDWKMPDFKSECWMVASGVANKLDLISPKSWGKQACEHAYPDKIKTQRLIAHELVHVNHGQLNASPDFSDVTDIDWFVGGLATYASGQCDSMRVAEIKKAIDSNLIPTSLNKFWTGNLKYGLSGSVAMYIDNKYGRNKLKELLKFNKENEILSSLKATEPELLNGWRKYMALQ